MKKILAAFAAFLALAPAALAKPPVLLTPDEAATVLHSGGPKTTKVICIKAKSKFKNVFYCKVYLVRSLNGHHCLATFFIVPDKNPKDVKYDQVDQKFCDAGAPKS